MSTRRPGDTIAAHPALDWIPVLGVAVALVVLAGLDPWNLAGDLTPLDSVTSPPFAEQRTAYYGGVATIAGLALAAATFACTMTYQSSNFLMSHVHQRYAPELRRNWASVLASTLVCAIVAVLLILGDSWSPALAVVVSTTALSLVLVRGLRALFWLRLTLFLDEAAALTKTLTGPAPVKKRTASASR